MLGKIKDFHRVKFFSSKETTIRELLTLVKKNCKVGEKIPVFLSEEGNKSSKFFIILEG